jgi:hypothetical protein
MAHYSINVIGEAVAASTVETILQVVAPANKPVRVSRWGVSFNGVDVTDQPVRVELIRLTSAGTSSAFTPVKLNPNDEPAVSTARTAHTAEPTATDVLEAHYVSPAGGNLVEVYSAGYPDERPVAAPNGRIGIRVLAVDAVNVTAFLIFEE